MSDKLLQQLVLHKLMVQTARSALVCAVAFCAFVLVSNVNGNETVAEIPDSIRSKLIENATAFNQVSIDYDFVRSSDLPLHKLLLQIESTERPELFERDKYRLRFQHGRWSLYSKYWISDAEGKPYFTEALTTFDGELQYGSSCKDYGSNICIRDARYHRNHYSIRAAFGYNDLLTDMGFAVPKESVDTWKPLESVILYRLRKGGKLVSVGGNPQASSGDFEIVLLFNKLQYRYLLDLGKNCAVRQWEEQTRDGKKKYVTTNSRFVKVPGSDVLLPEFCRMACYTWPRISKIYDTPLLYEDVVVTRLGIDPVPDDEFVIDWKVPGNKVGDSRIAKDGDERGFVGFRVPANLKYLDQVIEAAAEGREFVEPVDSRSWGWLLWANLGIAGVVAVIYFMRRGSESSEPVKKKRR